MSVLLLLSRINPGFKVSSEGSWSSFPVDNKEIVGLLMTLIAVAPTVAKRPISAGPVDQISHLQLITFKRIGTKHSSRVATPI